MGHFKAVQSGDIVEIWEYTSHINVQKVKRRKKRRSRPFLPRLRNVRAKKKNFERLVRSNVHGKGAPNLLTLTMRDVVNLKEAYSCFTRFGVKLRRTFPEVAWVAVPEFQKRGAVHFHAFVWGVPLEYVERERKSRYVAGLWGQGYVDFIRSDGKDALIGYLSKYMSKAMHDERLLGQRGYTSSRNCVRPVSISGATAASYAPYAFGTDGVDNKVEYKREYDTKWLGRCTYKVIKLLV